MEEKKRKESIHIFQEPRPEKRTSSIHYRTRSSINLLRSEFDWEVEKKGRKKGEGIGNERVIVLIHCLPAISFAAFRHPLDRGALLHSICPARRAAEPTLAIVTHSGNMTEAKGREQVSTSLPLRADALLLPHWMDLISLRGQQTSIFSTPAAAAAATTIRQRARVPKPHKLTSPRRGHEPAELVDTETHTEEGERATLSRSFFFHCYCSPSCMIPPCLSLSHNAITMLSLQYNHFLVTQSPYSSHNAHYRVLLYQSPSFFLTLLDRVCTLVSCRSYHLS
jgi:hypothetical protein